MSDFVPNAPMLKVGEIAIHLRVSKMSVYRLIESGDLPCIRVGRSMRVPRRAYLEYLARNSTSQEPSDG